MATTTNYGWTTPDDTSLVKDGASAIRSLGSSIDTTTKNLNPETALGDIAYRSGTTNVNTRLGIGTTGQVLTVSGGVPVWQSPSSGSLTQIATGTMSTQSVTLSSIPQTYKSLYVTITDASMNANSQAAIRFNTSTTGYTGFGVRCNNTSGASTFSDTGGASARILGASMVANTADSNIAILIPNYAVSGIYKQFSVYSNYTNTTPEVEGYLGAGYNSSITAAIDQIILFSVGSTWSAGTYTLFGVL